MRIMSDVEREYFDVYLPAFLKSHSGMSRMSAPKLIKVIVNRGFGSEVGTNSKVVDLSYDRFISIAGQKPLIKLAKKSISNFKLREGQPVGCMYTLRSSKMFDFLTKILHLALPRIRDFRGLPRNSFDGFGNYAFGLKADNIFPELTFEDTDKQRGMNIVVVTSAKSDESALDLLESLGFPFRKN